MLFLLFQIGDDTYALETTQIIEVLPLLQIKAVPQAAEGVAGLINYRGRRVPVIDPYPGALQRSALRRMSTRLVVLQFDRVHDGMIALLAEHATACTRLDPTQFADSGVVVPRARFLGPVATNHDGRLIQWIKPDALISEAVYAALLAESPAVS